MTNAVAVKNENAIAMTGLASFEDMETDLGFDSSDLVTPRIVIVGDLSPQKKKSSEKYIEGVETGDIVDDSTGEILAKFEKETFDFLPVARTKEAIRWKPKRAGLASRTTLAKGHRFDAFAESEGLTRNDDYQYIYPNGDELVEHWNYFGLDLSRGGTPAFISMKKTNMKIGKRWNTLMENAKLPNGKKSPRMYTHVYSIGAFLDSGNDNEWPNWTVSQKCYLGDLENADELFERANSLFEIVNIGAYRADIAEDAVDEEIPF